jgi:hypothetical protein
MASAWGKSWGGAWLNSWGFVGGADTHDGADRSIKRVKSKYPWTKKDAETYVKQELEPTVSQSLTVEPIKKALENVNQYDYQLEIDYKNAVLALARYEYEKLMQEWDDEEALLMMI